MRDLTDFIVEIIPAMIGLTLALFVVMVPIYFYAKAACQAQTEGFESRFGILTDCQVQVNGRWLQWEHYRATEEANPQPNKTEERK